MEDEFFLVLNTDGTYIYDVDGDVLIQRKVDGAQFYVNPGVVGEVVGGNVEATSHEELLNDEDTHTTMPQVNEQGKTRWTREEILSLIDLYKKNKTKFASTTIKNTKVWQTIAESIQSHDWKQCENKFKYLKSKYLQKKDNMSIKSSGARHIHFEYFEEFDEMFAKEPNVEPLAIASSSRSNDILEEDVANSTQPDNNNSQISTDTRSSRNIKLKDSLIELNQILKKSEEDKAKRHEELLRLQQQYMESFFEKMNKILDKV